MRNMKESILDVLLYLFEHYLSADADLVQDRNSLITGPLFEDLGRAGFSAEEIKRAFEWLDSLDRQRPAGLSAVAEAPVAHQPRPTRVFHGPELEKLDVASQGFLMKLEQQGVLTPVQREVVLDRAMALEQDPLELDDLKWVVLMVLFNQPGSEAAYAWMETQIFDAEPESVH